MELIVVLLFVILVILVLGLTAIFSPITNEAEPIEKVPAEGTDPSWDEFLEGHPELLEPSKLPV